VKWRKAKRKLGLRERKRWVRECGERREEQKRGIEGPATETKKMGGGGRLYGEGQGEVRVRKRP